MQGVPELYAILQEQIPKVIQSQKCYIHMGLKPRINELVAIAVSGMCTGIDIFIQL